MTRESRAALVADRLDQGYCRWCARRQCKDCATADCTCAHIRRRMFPTGPLKEWAGGHGRQPSLVLTRTQYKRILQPAITADVADALAYAFGAHPSEIWEDWWQN